ncbi:MAG: hypothetical protein K6E29_09335 [Cyanobacteria bacterium RUI128]|nr:hypothetical protein [Cyanobacteria bacterium RUI128]
MQHSEILSTIQSSIKHKPTQQELADALGYNLGTISARAARNSNYSIDEIKKLEECFDCKILSFNKDEYVNSLAAALAADYTNKQMSSDSIEVDYFPDVFGSCGNGTFVLSEQKEKILVPKRQIENFSPIKQYSVINAYGDSMMPYIQDKDELIVEHYDNEQIKDNRVYVFRIGDKFFIKRLVLNINQVVIKSDNTMYEPVIIKGPDLEDFQIIGKIVGLFRRMG